MQNSLQWFGPRHCVFITKCKLFRDKMTSTKKKTKTFIPNESKQNNLRYCLLWTQIMQQRLKRISWHATVNKVWFPRRDIVSRRNVHCFRRWNCSCAIDFLFSATSWTVLFGLCVDGWFWHCLQCVVNDMIMEIHKMEIDSFITSLVLLFYVYLNCSKNVRKINVKDILSMCRLHLIVWIK